MILILPWIFIVYSRKPKYFVLYKKYAILGTNYGGNGGTNDLSAQ